MKSQEVGRTPANRPKRTPLGQRNVMTFKQRPGYVRRLFNDVNSRLADAEDAGYTFVMDHSADTSHEGVIRNTKEGAVSKRVGGGITGYLMEIPEEFYVEDQAAKQRRVDATVQGLKSQQGIRGKQYGGTYGKIEIESARGKQALDAGQDEGGPD